MKGGKLEIKDICGYIPHGLAYQAVFYNDITVIHNYFDYYILNKIIENLDKDTPILRPISDLYKTIIHNGNEIVPIVELARITRPALNWKLAIDVEDLPCASDTDYFYEFDFDTKMRSFVMFWKNTENLVPNQFQLFDYLDELKIDYRGLIDAGLAIDANALECSPYNN
jgi:hypothetical protein